MDNSSLRYAKQNLVSVRDIWLTTNNIDLRTALISKIRRSASLYLLLIQILVVD